MPKPLRTIEDAGAPLKRTSLWKGPYEEGITYSKLCKFLCCRERFRLNMVEGLKEDEGFKYAIEFGNYWHEAEEAHAGKKPWLPAVKKHYEKLRAQYPANEAEVTKWYMIAKMLFPIYVNHYRNHETQLGRKPVYQEVSFKNKYTLPSGRTIILRGKIDEVFEQKRFRWIGENKTKGDRTLDWEGIGKTAEWNLQTCLYHINARILLGSDHRISGTCYNVIRRPLSDQYAIRQRTGRMNKKTGKRDGAETMQAFVERLKKDCILKDPAHYFLRKRVVLTEQRLSLFKDRVLHPILEQLCDWWDSIKDDPFNPWGNPLHYQAPWGVYNSMASGFRGDYFDLLTTGKQRNLIVTDELFPEL